jgi:hypothetical protein
MKDLAAFVDGLFHRSPPPKPTNVKSTPIDVGKKYVQMGHM